MAETRRYKVAVTEILRKIVVVEAKDGAEAHQRVRDAWSNGEYRLDESNSDGAEFHVLGESDSEDEKDLEIVDGKDAGDGENGDH